MFELLNGEKLPTNNILSFLKTLALIEATSFFCFGHGVVKKDIAESRFLAPKNIEQKAVNLQYES